MTAGALGYLLHLLRSVDFAGSLHANPYLRSIGVVGASFLDRVRAVPGVSVRSIADLVELHFDHSTLCEWVRATQDCD